MMDIKLLIHFLIHFFKYLDGNSDWSPTVEAQQWPKQMQMCRLPLSFAQFDRNDIFLLGFHANDRIMLYHMVRHVIL